ncbi:hypothetical protein [Acetobacter senegalensis]|uniref:hypothetical protein n=1 Tax=Acetobacter senegalensis TaxID=446692 RepID=UPI001ED9C7AA|nr:hypothetical protein [Acetobacter senegalensis]MCG4272581.1 hypothetical protein [Acetobacter senegalensis]
MMSRSTEWHALAAQEEAVFVEIPCLRSSDKRGSADVRSGPASRMLWWDHAAGCVEG